MKCFVDTYLDGRRGEHLRVLDVGSMDVNGSYRQYFDDAAWAYTGADVEPGPGVDLVLASPIRWRELRSGTFDVVISGQALEHIEFPWVTILEIARVLKTGGIACLIAPAGGYEHRYPLDCWRYFPDGARALARWGDLDVVYATTNTETSTYTDDSALWMDTTLIATKPRRRVAARLKVRLLATTLRLQARRRSSI